VPIMSAPTSFIPAVACFHKNRNASEFRISSQCHIPVAESSPRRFISSRGLRSTIIRFSALESRCIPRFVCEYGDKAESSTAKYLQLGKQLVQDLYELEDEVFGNSEYSDPQYALRLLRRAQKCAESMQSGYSETADHILALAAQVKAAEKRYQLAVTDYENLADRTTKEKADIERKALGKIVLSFLPLLDNFDRAQQMIIPTTPGETNIHVSYQTVYRLMVDGLAKLGIRQVGSEGERFDARLHEAYSREETDDFEEGTIVKCFLRGYVCGDSLLRPAAVSVAKNINRSTRNDWDDDDRV